MALFGLFGCGSEQLEASRISSVRYASGGGMEGGGSSIKLERQKDGSITLECRSRERWDSRELIDTYQIDESVFEEFAHLSNEYGLPRASRRGPSPFEVLDAPTLSIAYMILDEKGALDLDASFTVNSTQDLSNRELEGFDAVASALRALVPETGDEHSLDRV